MKGLRLFFTALAAFGLSCNSVNDLLNKNPTPTDTVLISNANCLDPQLTQQEIDAARKSTQEYFTSPGWQTSYTVMDYRISVTWKNDDLSSVANFDRFVFCGVTNAALDDYYTKDTFGIIFQNYDEHEAQKDCRSGDLRLYEFKVKNQGYDYNAKFWVDMPDENHVRESLLVFLIEDNANMDSYSKRIMPKLPSCE